MLPRPLHVLLRDATQGLAGAIVAERLNQFRIPRLDAVEVVLGLLLMLLVVLGLRLRHQLCRPVFD